MTRNTLGSRGFADEAGKIASLRDDVKAFREDVRRGSERVVRESSDGLRNRVEENAPRSDRSDYDDGSDRLADSVSVERIDDRHYRVVVDHPAAEPQEYGTESYEIRATTQEYLQFKVDGEWVQVRSVDHPGVPETRFARDAMDEMRPIMRRRLATELREAKERHFE